MTPPPPSWNLSTCLIIILNMCTIKCVPKDCKRNENLANRKVIQKTKLKFKMEFSTKRRTPPLPPLMDKVNLTWNGFYTWSRSKISLLSPLIIGSKLTFSGWSDRWLPCSEHTCKKREIPEIYLCNFFWIFRKILGWERQINTAPKPLPEVAPSKMEVPPF